MPMGKERAERERERGGQRKRGEDGRSCRKKEKDREKGKTEDKDRNMRVDHKERKEEKTVDQVETHRNKTKETHPSRRLSIKRSLCYYPNL